MTAIDLRQTGDAQSLGNGGTCCCYTNQRKHLSLRPHSTSSSKQHVIAIQRHGRAGHSISDDALCPSCTKATKKFGPREWYFEIVQQSFVTNTTINIQLAHLLVPWLVLMIRIKLKQKHPGRLEYRHSSTHNVQLSMSSDELVAGLNIISVSSITRMG